MNLILPLLGLMGGAKYAKKKPPKNNNQKTKTKQNPKNPQKTQKPHLLDKPKARLWCL